MKKKEKEKLLDVDNQILILIFVLDNCFLHFCYIPMLKYRDRVKD